MKRIILFTVLLFSFCSSFSQNTGIGTTTPASSAILDVNSTTKGLLMPRMTTVQRDAIVSPVVGLQIFNLDNQCTDIYDGAHWIENCGFKATGTYYDPNHPTSNSWTQKANFGGPIRNQAAGFSIGNYGYIGTGSGVGGSYMIDLWQYDQLNNVWTQKADFAGAARYGAVGLSIGNFGYIGTGYGVAGFFNDFFQYNPALNSWTAKANFGGVARSAAVGFSIGNKGFIGTGQDLSGYLNDFFQYNPALDSWTAKANFGGVARVAAVGFSIGGRGYIGTGYNGAVFSDFYQYDTTADTWTAKASLPASRYFAAGFSLGDKGYIGTGRNLSSYLNDFYRYDTTANTWTAKAIFPGANRNGAVGFSINNKGYIGTGYNGSSFNDFYEYMDNDSAGLVYSSGATLSLGNNSFSNGLWTISNNNIYNANTGPVGVGTNAPATSAILDIKSTTKGFLMPRMTTTQRDAIVLPVTGLQIFNLDDQCTDIYDGSHWIETCGLKVTGTITDPGHLTTNSWAQKADLSVGGRNSPAGFSINGKGYIGTGTELGVPTYDFWQFDPVTNTWTQKATFAGGQRTNAVGFSIGNKGYIGTGADAFGALSGDFWQYDPVTNTWTAKANFGGGTRQNAVGFSIGNKGYIGTGDNGSSFFNDFWQYDTTVNTWTAKANVGGLPRNVAAGFSIGGRGYIGLGNTTGSGYQKDFWQYDTTANSWTQKANFGGTARTLASGCSMADKGYIGPGYDGANRNDFWQYDTTANTWTQKANFGGTARSGGVAFSISNKLYYGMGYDNSNERNDFWEYMDNNVNSTIYSSNSNLSTNNIISDGAWTINNNNIYNANTGNIGIGTASPATNLDVEGGIKTKYSGSIVTSSLTVGNQFVNLTIPSLPAGWDLTNSMVLVTNADGVAGTINQAKLTSLTNIQLNYTALGTGAVRFSYIVFKL